MISSISVTGFRGVRSAKIEGLTPVSVLVGRNGCGKSTVLDALAIAASPSPAPQLTESIERRTTDDSNLGIDWILTKGLTQGSITISGEGNSRALRLTREGDSVEIRTVDAPRSSPPLGSVRAQGGTSSGGVYRTPPMPSELRFIDLRSRARLRRPPHDLYSEARASGRKKVILDLLRSLLTGVEDLEILTVQDKPTLFLSYADRAIPLSLSGDGVRNVTILAFELGVPANALILVEEPETHLHPGAMAKAAEAMIHAVRPKAGAVSQLVLATHSLEFIDALVRAAQSLNALDMLSVHRLSLEEGVMASSSLGGELVLDARAEAELELR
jgi:hypothetical protein